jgi:hypothetical protein
MTKRIGCGEFGDVAAELALGVLTGRERADALAHLEGCDACLETVHQLTTTGEGLLGLLPEAEPPAGFESRVLARIGLLGPQPAPAAGREVAARRPRRARQFRQSRRGSPVRPSWRVSSARQSQQSQQSRQSRQSSPVRRVLVAAAVVVAVVAAALGGWGLRGAASHPAQAVASSPLRSAELTSASRQPVGEVFYYTAGQRWMYMTVDLPSGDGTVTCELEGPGGHYTRVGSFRLAAGYGSWGGPAGYGPVTGARLVGADGRVLATASLS